MGLRVRVGCKDVSVSARRVGSIEGDRGHVKVAERRLGEEEAAEGILCGSVLCHLDRASAALAELCLAAPDTDNKDWVDAQSAALSDQPALRGMAAILCARGAECALGVLELEQVGKIQTAGEQVGVDKVASGRETELLEDDGDQGAHRICAHVAAEQSAGTVTVCACAVWRLGCEPRLTVPPENALTTEADLGADIGKSAWANVGSDGSLEDTGWEVGVAEMEELGCKHAKERVSEGSVRGL